MQTVTCEYCGLPFKVRETHADELAQVRRGHYCCTGCAILARVPVDEKGQFPVNAHLVSLIAVGFLYFNQLLCWLLGILVAYQGKAGQAAGFYWISAGLAFVVWVAIIVVQWSENASRTSDRLMLGIIFAAHVWAVVTAVATFGGNASGGATRLSLAWLMAAGNAVLICWSIRGVFRRRKRIAKID